MSLANTNKLFGCATAAAAIGLLIGPAPAQAYPPAPLAPNDCTGYQFPGGKMTFHYPNIGETKFDTIAGGTHVDTKATTFYPNGSSMPGTVIGDINGRSIHLEVTRERYTPLILDGTVGDDGRGHGDLTFRDNESGTWDSLQQFKCVAAQQGPAPAPSQQKTTMVVGGPVDIFNIAHDEVPDPNTGIRGMKIGTLEDGQLVVRADGGPCVKNSWCKIVLPGGDPKNFDFGFVNGHLQ